MKFKRKEKKPEIDQRRTPAPNNAPVFSYYASRSRTENPTGRNQNKVVQPNTDHQSRIIPPVLAAVAIIGGILYILWLDTSPRVDLLITKDEASMLQDKHVYQAAARTILSSSIFNRTKLTINTEEVAHRLQSQFPELADVAVTTPLVGHRPVFEIAPAKPRLVLASDFSGTYVLDERGRAVVPAREVPKLGQLKLPVIHEESSLDISVGKSVLTTENTQFILDVIAHLTVKDQVIDNLVLPTIANELHVRLKGQPYYIKFNMRGNARLQVGTYLATSNNLKKSGITPAEYVDVRVEEKAYYK